jgi:hypothetical protein
MVRLENDQYKLQLEKIDLTSKDILQQMYNSLKAIVENHCEQWYFLHEEIPFVDNQGQ